MAKLKSPLGWEDWKMNWSLTLVLIGIILFVLLVGLATLIGSVYFSFEINNHKGWLSSYADAYDADGHTIGQYPIIVSNDSWETNYLYRANQTVKYKVENSTNQKFHHIKWVISSQGLILTDNLYGQMISPKDGSICVTQSELSTVTQFSICTLEEALDWSNCSDVNDCHQLSQSDFEVTGRHYNADTYLYIYPRGNLQESTMEIEVKYVGEYTPIHSQFTMISLLISSASIVVLAVIISIVCVILAVILKKYRVETVNEDEYEEGNNAFEFDEKMDDVIGEDEVATILN